MIIRELEGHTAQRQLPSDGLNMLQISQALKKMGFGTRFYNESEFGTEFYEIINSYIESGIPVIIGLESLDNTLGHVIVGIGKKYAYDVVDLNFLKNMIEVHAPETK